MLKTLLAIGALQLVTMLFQLVRTKILALLLGPELVGAMAVIDKLLAVIVQTCSLSLPFAALRFLPEQWARGPAEFRSLFERMRNLLLALTLPAMAGALLVTAVRPEIWGVRLLPYRGALAAAMFSIPVLALLPLLQNAIAGRLQHHRSMMIGVLNAVVLAVAALGVWWRGLAGYYLVYAALGLVLLGVCGRFVTRGTRTSPAPAGAESGSVRVLGLPRPMWRFSGALITLAFVAPYAALFVHYRLLRDHGAEAAGWMQAAFGIGLSVRAVLGSAHPVFLTPNVNRGGTPQDRMDWANRFQTTFCFLAAVVVPPILLFPDAVVRLLYSSAFLPAATFAMVFVMTEVGILLSGTYQSLVISLDRVGAHVAYNLAAQLLVILVASQLVRPLGILGAGLAGLAAPTFTLIATTTFLRRAYGLQIPHRILGLSGCLLLGLLAAGVSGIFIRGSLWHEIPAKLAVYLLIVGGFTLLLTDDERFRLRRTVGDLRARFFPATA